MCNCNNIKPQTYENSTSLPKPFGRKNYVSVDNCILLEVLELWHIGIETTGCCCGHNSEGLAFIGVKNEFIPKMKNLGYIVKYNQCRPNDEDSFIPKTKY